jgi:phosphoglucosamine mutase
LTADFVRYPQVLLNVPVAEQIPIEDLSEFSQTVQKIERALDGRGRVLIRYSGTEPLARIMVEGDDEERIGEYAHDLAEALRQALGG